MGQSAISPWTMNIKIFSFLVLSLIWVSPIEAGVRCTLGGDTGCSAGCALLGQTSGICDDEGECWCSERSIGVETIRELLPSRCTLGLEFCQKSCYSIGRKVKPCPIRPLRHRFGLYAELPIQGKSSGNLRGMELCLPFKLNFLKIELTSTKTHLL